MRSPTRALAGNLRWTRSGVVWADWLLHPLPYGFRPVKDKKTIRGLHQALFRALPGESLLLGVCAGLDPAAVVERMITDVRLPDCPEWAAECEATLSTLDEIGPGQRVHWLSVPLGARRARDRMVEPFRAAGAEVRDVLGLPRAPIAEAEVARRLEQAQLIADAIPAPFRARPASPAQMVWLELHAQQRGLFLDLDLPQAGSVDPTGQLLTARAGAALPEPLLDEGGQSDLHRRERRSWNPLHRRYLKVAQAGRADDPPSSYQSLLVLTDVPADGMVFPGSEFIGRIDECGLDVDWAMRLDVRSSAQVAAQNRRALVNLNEQYGQREGELGHGLNALDRAAADLAEYARVIESDKLEVEVQPTTVFAVAAADPAGALAQAAALSTYLGHAGYKVTQPLGYQQDLWWAMQPGSAATKAVREFAQITTSRALAAAVPLASSDLGDSKGSLLGLNISTGRPGVVLHDIAGASDRDVSGSLAIAGELGAGKALALDTPIPTPGGWARLGDLAPGDWVFDETGERTAVLAVSPVMIGRRCYRVVFSDGSAITADAAHLWPVVPGPVFAGPGRRPASLGAGGGTRLLERADIRPGPSWPAGAAAVTTEQLRRGVACGKLLPAIPTTRALRLPEADLPVDPRLLGGWLGSSPDTEPAGPQAAELAALAPEGGGRCIPTRYLRGSVGQRQALLTGLTAAAGSPIPGGGTVIRLVGERLARGVHELGCSLGFRPVLRETRRRCGRGSGEAPWTVLFPPAAASRHHRIVAVHPVASEPVRCIRVASASRLFLAGRAMVATHNSLTLKTQAGAVVDRGGRVIAADRTAVGEYAAWASSVTRATVVDVNDPTMSLDPLRLFGPVVGSRVTQSFLTPLLNIAPTSDRGVLLSDVLDPPYLAECRITGLGGLLAHLKDGCELPGAAELARTMNVFARRDFGRVIFDASLPPLPIDVPAVVIRTHTLELPSRSELEHEHLFAQMRLEKLYGRAVYALIAALARQICFSDPNTLGLFVVDEAHHVTSSPEGEREIVEFVRDGRKHKAAVALGSHDPEADFGSPTLRGLIPTRILMRHRDRTLAKRGLAWLDLDPDDDDLVQLLTEDTSPVGPNGVAEHRRGEAFLRDSSGSIGRLKVLAPSLSERNAAVRTSPPEKDAVPRGAS